MGRECQFLRNPRWSTEIEKREESRKRKRWRETEHGNGRKGCAPPSLRRTARSERSGVVAPPAARYRRSSASCLLRCEIRLPRIHPASRAGRTGPGRGHLLAQRPPPRGGDRSSGWEILFKALLQLVVLVLGEEWIRIELWKLGFSLKSRLKFLVCS